MNSKCVEQRCGKREIRKTDYDMHIATVTHLSTKLTGIDVEQPR